jgi:hypothetical protein
MTDDDLLAPDQSEPKDYLAAMTAPGAKFDKTKYKTDAELLQAMAKSGWHADNTISTKNKAFDDLSADYIRLKEEVDKGPKVQELFDQMTQRLNSQNQVIQQEVNQVPAFDPKQVETMISNSLQAHELNKIQKSNQDLVRAKLQERYGSDYAGVVKQQIEDLGVSEDLFKSLAKNNPKLLIKTLGLDQEKQQDLFQAPPQSSVRTDSFSPRGGQKRTWSYYQELKNKDRNLYSDPKTQTQMIMDHAALGREFEDGNYNDPRFR